MTAGAAGVDRFRTLARDAFDVVVVGAGPGGLCTAALLARRGKRVLIIDQHYVPGGNMSSFRRRGYEFAVGLHYVGDCHPAGIIPRILRAAGAGDIAFESMESDGFDRLVLPDLEFAFPRGIEAFRARLLELFPAERRGIERYFSFMRQLQVLAHAFGRPLATAAALPRVLPLLRWGQRSFAEFLDSCTSDVTLRAVLAGQHIGYALPPSRVSMLLGIGMPLHVVESGAYYPKGGGQAIADALAASIEDHGGTVLLRTRAKRIAVEGGRVTGVVIANNHIGERVIRAPIVVSNADLKRTYLELVGAEQLSERTVASVRGYEMSPALGCVHLGIRRPPGAAPLPRAHFCVQPSLDLEGEYGEVAAGRFVDSPALVVSVASVKDPENPALAPPGITNVQLMALAPSAPLAWGVTEAEVATGAYRKAPAYIEKKSEYSRRLIRVAERALPGLSEQIVYEEVSTPLTHTRYTLSTGGTSYGLAATPRQFVFGRPDAKTEIKGLYLCGASCRTGHGVMGGMMSGVVAAAHVGGHGLMREVLDA